MKEMKLNEFLMISGFLLILSLSGCTSQINQGTISLENVITNREVYHSSELMKIKAIVESDANIENVTVKVSGINGRLNQERTIELTEGLNEVSFSFHLPRCNVCGGIREGDYDITAEVIFGDISLTKVKTVSIRQ